MLTTAAVCVRRNAVAFLALIVALCGSAGAVATGAAASTDVHASISTKPLPGVPCSVSAYLSLDYGAGSMSYRGAASCRDGQGQKTLDLAPQVYRFVNGHRLWFDISLDGRYQGPTPINPLRLSATRQAVAEHVYRLLAYARVTLPDGRSSSLTVCAGCAGAPKSSSPSTLSIRPGYNYPAEPATAAKVSGIPCFVEQDGLYFTLVNGTYVVNYGGYATCYAPHLGGQRSLTICVQVGNHINGKGVWFTIRGSCMSEGPVTSDTATLSTARTAFLGHGYRIMASGTIRYPTLSGTITRSATTYGAAAGP